jgi:hypothetical protein
LDVTDLIFAGQRCDSVELDQRVFRNCTFANISFKGATIKNCRFENCAFLACYFRRTTLKDSKFSASKFFDCSFPNTAVHTCVFDHVSFRGCFVEPDELNHSLPQAPNLRYALTANLAREAEALGHARDARTFRLWSIEARHKDLYAAWMHQDSWYRVHYPGVRRATAFFEWLKSQLNGIVWGHGERLLALVRSVLVTTFLLFPFVFVLERSAFCRDAVGTCVSLDSAPILEAVPDALFLSLDNMLPVAGISTLRPVNAWGRSFVALEVLIGVIFAGLIVVYIFRAVVRR